MRRTRRSSSAAMARSCVLASGPRVRVLGLGVSCPRSRTSRTRDGCVARSPRRCSNRPIASRLVHGPETAGPSPAPATTDQTPDAGRRPAARREFLEMLCHAPRRAPGVPSGLSSVRRHAVPQGKSADSTFCYTDTGKAGRQNLHPAQPHPPSQRVRRAGLFAPHRTSSHPHGTRSHPFAPFRTRYTPPRPTAGGKIIVHAVPHRHRQPGIPASAGCPRPHWRHGRHLTDEFPRDELDMALDFGTSRRSCATSITRSWSPAATRRS